MNKKFEKYFGKNIARKVYVLGIALIAIGVAVAYGYFAGYGVPIMGVGVLLFFVSSSMQVSDKDIDEKVITDMNAYAKEKIEGKTIGKEVLNANDFSVFSGHIREHNNVRFKAGRDGKIRTSNYYVTAISANKGDCKVFTTVYDMITGETQDNMICTKGADAVEFTHTPTEFPSGNFRCELKVTRESSCEELVFFVPNDALADKLLARIK